jgi:hypothetical protein
VGELLCGPPPDDGLDHGELAALLTLAGIEGPALGAVGNRKDGVPASERDTGED